MAREKLEFSNTPTINPGDLKEGEEVNGKFLGLKLVRIEKYKRDSTLIRLADVNGVEFGMWANSAIEQRSLDLQPGEVYIFVATGEQKNPKTGRTFKGFDVYHGDASELTFNIEEALDVETPEPEPVVARRRR